jgi:hypothetical protein
MLNSIQQSIEKLYSNLIIQQYSWMICFSKKTTKFSWRKICLFHNSYPSQRYIINCLILDLEVVYYIFLERVFKVLITDIHLNK